MGERTKIEWAHHTFNPWYGCQKVGPGCDHCYAEAWAKRSGLVKWGPGAERRRSSPANWRKPLQWNRRSQIAHDAWQHGIELTGGNEKELLARGFVKPERPRVFCASLADVFDNAVPADWRMDLFSLIAQTPYLDWLLVTKRVGNVMPMCSRDSLMFDMLSSRVWLGITVCNQQEADRDIPKLLQIPAKVRWLSMEPLLGPVDISEWIDPDYFTGCADDGIKALHWVVAGGESGSNARPMHSGWARSLRDQCQGAGVPFFFKQWGEYSEDLQHGLNTGVFAPIRYYQFADGVIVERVGKKYSGRMLDGILHEAYPERCQ
ncbi:phage Gp37/Gp68 family protein [Nitrosovibrio sp. Nv6]|uniref:phage Gp37/Gp68 family protein n=1 Tax=Nitrosovibrio sp. Nv6 TaxID=1855340 RepID=UPI0008C46ACF|nr:phage Gp37/Gp68 family protein [Nitrosovibrio sp. Nv6]SEO65505.1 protein gp37 [Nitrosovibrio sp. Nv6]